VKSDSVSQQAGWNAGCLALIVGLHSHPRQSLFLKASFRATASWASKTTGASWGYETGAVSYFSLGFDFEMWFGYVRWATVEAFSFKAVEKLGWIGRPSASVKASQSTSLFRAESSESVATSVHPCKSNRSLALSNSSSPASHSCHASSKRRPISFGPASDLHSVTFSRPSSLEMSLIKAGRFVLG